MTHLTSMIRVARSAALCGCLVLSAGFALFAQTPYIVGEFEPLAIESPHPYPAIGLGKSDEVFFPSATYVRLHFAKFELAPGDWLEVSNLKGTERYRYELTGPHGSGEFWANAILGDTAVVTINAPQGGGFGFVIDGAGRGTVPLDGSGAAPESVCGTQDWRDAKCYESSRPTEYARGRGSVLALIGCCSSCTAFKVSDSGQFMTNNHCTASQSGVQSTELRFEYQTPGCGSGSPAFSGSVFGSALQRTDATLDYTLMTTTGSSSSIPCLELEPRLPPVGERIYIAGHPSGGPKKLSIDSDRNTGNVCRVDASPHPGNSPTSDVGYFCDTTNGSSGSPVLSGDTNKVVALHHFGGCLNSGARIDLIHPQVASLLTGCAGGGGGPSCGNGTCGAGETPCNCPADCGAAPNSEAGLCSNGIDDDCGGGTDCGDADCAGAPPCPFCGDGSCGAGESKCNCAADCGVAPGTETGLCTNGIDDDCGGGTDCADSDCVGTPACPSCRAAGQSCTFNRDCCSNRCQGPLGRKNCR
jgi:hypothetical protein